jgi:hypothetical protein
MANEPQEGIFHSQEWDSTLDGQIAGAHLVFQPLFTELAWWVKGGWARKAHE